MMFLLIVTTRNCSLKNIHRFDKLFRISVTVERLRTNWLKQVWKICRWFVSSLYFM